MKFDINNPAFMQAAGNTPKVQYFIKMIFSGDNPDLYISTDGGFVVKSIYQGEMISREYETSARIVIEADAGTTVLFTGMIYEISDDSTQHIPVQFITMSTSIIRSILVIDIY